MYGTTTMTGVSFAALPLASSEGVDAPASVQTPYSLAVGESFSGLLSSGGDSDWLSLSLAAGEALALTVEGHGSTPMAGFGLVTTLRSETGALLAVETGYSEASSWISWTNPDLAPRRVYLEVAAFSPADAGGYLVVRDTGAAPGASLGAEGIADRLVAGGPGWTIGPGGSIAVDLGQLDAAAAGMARTALQAWSRTTGIDFAEVALDPADPAGILFETGQTGAYTTLARDVSGAIVSAWVSVGADVWETGGSAVGGLTWLAYLHEIGHALGLADAGSPAGAAPGHADDHWQMSVMAARGQPGPPDGASWAVPLTPMPADIVAAARLYGAPAGAAADDDVYGPAGRGGAYDGLSDRLAGQAVTLVDAGGHDLLDLSPSGADQRIDLTPGAASDAAGLLGNLILAPGTVIEDLRGGSGADRLSGNDAANRLEGGAGADRLDGRAGDDVLDGGDGDDTLTGGEGADEFVFRIHGGADHVTDFGDGTDRFRLADLSDPRIMLEPALGGVTLVSEDGARLFVAGITPDLIGSDDFLWGRPGTLIFGTTGTDRIEGTGGDDVIYGGSGEDDLWISGGNDTIDGGGGLDRLHLPRDSRVKIDLSSSQPQAVEGGHVTLRGIENLTAGKLGDTLTGTGSNNVIEGMGGYDIIEGRGGMDILIGGKGRDKIHGGDDRVRDVFAYETIYDSKPGSKRDVIYDFESRIDDIDLSEIDANVFKPGDQAFRFTGSRAAANAVWLHDIGRNLLVRGDVNGDARHDFEIEVANVATLLSKDFIL